MLLTQLLAMIEKFPTKKNVKNFGRTTVAKEIGTNFSAFSGFSLEIKGTTLLIKFWIDLMLSKMEKCIYPIRIKYPR